MSRVSRKKFRSKGERNLPQISVNGNKKSPVMIWAVGVLVAAGALR